MSYRRTGRVYESEKKKARDNSEFPREVCKAFQNVLASKHESWRKKISAKILIPVHAS